MFEHKQNLSLSMLPIAHLFAEEDGSDSDNLGSDCFN